MTRYIAFAFVACLTGCGGKTTSTAAETPAESIRTCETIRADVIRLTEKNPTSIVKIYNPVTVKNEQKKVSCSGRAMLSNAQEAIVYYRAFEDPEGDWLVEYAEKPLDG